MKNLKIAVTSVFLLAGTTGTNIAWSSNLINPNNWGTTGSAFGTTVWAPTIAGVSGSVFQTVPLELNSKYRVDFSFWGNAVEGGSISIDFAGTTLLNRFVWPQGDIRRNPAAYSYEIISSTERSNFVFSGSQLYGMVRLENTSVTKLQDNAFNLLTSRTCHDALSLPNSISVEKVALGTALIATFAPADGLTVAATDCGFVGFNWTQRVTEDPYPPKSAITQEPLQVPYQDRPPGGYLGGTPSAYPYYYSSLDLQKRCNYAFNVGGLLGTFSTEIQSSSHITFCDQPTEPRLKANESISFETKLVGLRADGSATPIYQIDWESNFDGIYGGISIRSNFDNSNEVTGNGGVAILARASLLPVPEPSTTLLTSFGLLAMLLRMKVRGKA